MRTQATDIPPSTAELPPIQVAVAADRHFLMPLAVVLASLSLTHEPGDVVVWVLHDGLRAPDRDQVVRGLDARLDVRWLRVPAADLKGVHHMPALTHATLFRLLLPSLLPASLNRVIYLDADTLVSRSLRPLWDTDLGGKALGAVRDAGSPYPAGPSGTDWRGLGLEPGDPYFNAGVMLVALEPWRSAEVSERALQVLRASTPRWGDQDGLNAALRGNWVEVPRRWNLQTPDVLGEGLAWALWRDDVERALADVAVIHYSASIKPWHARSRHPLARDWYDALAHTAWSGWRPVPRSRPLHRRVGSRTKRAWKVLIAPPAGEQIA
jgi:lipopolysaccharide biosynthesis glycosyltransferase